MREKRGLFDWVWSIARISLVILLLYLWLRYQEKQEQGPIHGHIARQCDHNVVHCSRWHSDRQREPMR